LAAGIPSEPLNDLIDGALIASSWMVAYKYFSWTMLQLDRQIDGKFIIRLGIVLVWAATFVWRLERFLLQERVWGDLPIGAHDYTRGFVMWVLVIAAALHAIGIDTERGDGRSTTLLHASLSGIAGALAILIIQLIIGDFGVQR
jgi:hypothetical protein